MIFRVVFYRVVFSRVVFRLVARVGSRHAIVRGERAREHRDPRKRHRSDVPDVQVGNRTQQCRDCQRDQAERGDECNY